MPEDVPAVPAETARTDSTPEVASTKVAEEATAPASGHRTSFRDIRRQLSEEELKQTGVQKLVIEDFERAEMECDRLRAYVDKYHAADKDVAKLTEKLRANTAMEILSAVGFAGGGAIVSLAPYFWEANSTKGIAAIGVGMLFILGSGMAKRFQVKQ